MTTGEEAPVPDIVLSERQQQSLRRLLVLEAAPGAEPPPYVLDLVSRLVPSDLVEQGLDRDRVTTTCSERDLAMLRMISPALERVLRARPTPVLDAHLTATECRVLQLVATGRSNAEIADDLYVSVATVRKHLEHAYRKLGVHSRMAAVVAFGARPTPPEATHSTSGSGSGSDSGSGSGSGSGT